MNDASKLRELDTLLAQTEQVPQLAKKYRFDLKLVCYCRMMQCRRCVLHGQQCCVVSIHYSEAIICTLIGNNTLRPHWTAALGLIYSFHCGLFCILASLSYCNCVLIVSILQFCLVDVAIIHRCWTPIVPIYSVLNQLSKD
jgi:hypothetical protein